MNTKENLKLTGRLNIVLKAPDGTVKDSREVDNLVVNTGLAFIVSRMVGTSSNVMSHMGVGTGTTAAAAGNTALETALGSRKSLDSTTIAGSNNEQVVYVATFAAGESTGAITEAGVFNASTSGTMLCRTVFSVVNKGAADSLVITWTITLAAV
jgi:hypothetical protein